MCLYWEKIFSRTSWLISIKIDNNAKIGLVHLKIFSKAMDPK
jgi:hypothetical protein